MAWQEPKTDWNPAQQEGVSAADFNRIEGNIAFLGQGSAILDADGNAYPTVVIGAQQWAARSWRSTTYADGTAIPEVTDQTAWDALTTPAYCMYDNFNTKYGLLYNYFTIDPTNPKALAPEGWRVATQTDFTSLAVLLAASGHKYDNTPPDGGDVTGYRLAKAVASIGPWPLDNREGEPGVNPWENNSSGLGLLACGKRTGAFSGVGSVGTYWGVTLGFRNSVSVLSGERDFKFITGQAATDGLGVVMVKDV